MKSNQEWIEWGRRDPLYGVAMWPGHQKDGARAWTDESFYELGRSDWERFERHWRFYGLVEEASCLEIGCGAGRLTKQLASVFVEVIAVDVSQDMIEYARHRVPGNVMFHVTDGRRLPCPDCSVGAVFSTHVFQHFDSLADAKAVFSEIARVISPGGTIMIHLPMYALPLGLTSQAMRVLYGAQKRLGDLRASWARHRAALLMRGLSYETGWLRHELFALGFEDVQFSTFDASDGSPHSFVLARAQSGIGPPGAPR